MNLFFSSAAQPFVTLMAVSNAYVFAFVLVAICAKRELLTETGFSHGKYYSLMGWTPLVFAALAITLDWRYLAFFAIAGVAGIGGELLVSVIWRWFFREPIWTYSYQSVLSGYTSTINFLPWAVGALLFHATARLLGLGTPPQLLEPMLVSATAFVVTMALVLPARRWTSAHQRRFSKTAFALFCLPIVATAIALGTICSPTYYALMIAFSIVGFLTEYGYGRSMSVFFERSLWTYNHWQIDGGHTSFVTLPLWALGGLYFYFIAACLGL